MVWTLDLIFDVVKVVGVIVGSFATFYRWVLVPRDKKLREKRENVYRPLVTKLEGLIQKVDDLQDINPSQW